jgi:hypothetical protein
MVSSSAGVDVMDASLARVDCLVESAPAEEHTALRGLGYEPCCCSRRHSRGVFTASSYPWSSYYKNLTAAALPGGCGDGGQLRALFFLPGMFPWRELNLVPEAAPDAHIRWARNPSWRQLWTSEPRMWCGSIRQRAGCGGFSSQRR